MFPMTMYVLQVLFSEVNPEAIRSSMMNEWHFRIMLVTVMFGVTFILERKHVSEQKDQ